MRRTTRGAISTTIVGSRLARSAVVALLVACASSPTAPVADPAARGDQLLIVDCLLPGQIRRIGNQATYATARRPAKLPASECEIRGGEYVAYDRASLSTSLRIWLPQAELGDAEAQVYVGEMFEKGLGVPPDFSAAATWYRRAADQGSSRGKINLGSLYERGMGVPKDPAQALEWYRRASGLKDSVFEIAAAPSDIGELERLRSEVAELRQQLRESELQLARERRQAESVQAQIQSGTSAAAEEEQEIKRLREQLEKVAASHEAASAETRRALENRIAESERDLATKNSEIARLTASLAALQKDSDQRRAEVERMRAESALAGPSIEILEPEVLATRGTRGIRVAASARELLLVGRVEAPAGLLTLTINGVESKLEKNALFRSVLPLEAGMERIRLVAIDRAGHKTIEELSLSGADAVAGGAGGPTSKRTIGLPLPGETLNFGRYHALVIGNNDYLSLPDLQTAKADAEAVARALEQRYGFTVTLLPDANRYSILSALNKLRAELTEQDNLLIYYAGHGDLDRVNQRGNWLPVDAERESSANWISNTSVTDILNAMSVRQLLVIADSCYSGTLTRSAVAQLEAGRSASDRIALIKALIGQKARMVLTSGGLEPVLDSVGGKHSDFAQAFLNAIEENQGILTGRELHDAILPRVASTASRIDFHQVPEYAPIKFAGHEAGDFLFVRKSN